MYNKKVLSKIDLGKFTKSDPYKDDIIYDPMGQWKYPGQNTRIPTPNGNITMGANPETGQPIPFPVFAQPNVGPGVMMQPGQEYNFPGANYVDEFPQAKEGMIVDLTPAQIEEYRKGGYIVEELDAYAEGGRSSSCPEGMVWSKKDKKCIKLLFNSNTLTNIKNRLNSTTGIPLTTLSDGLKIKPLNSFSDFGKEKPIPVREDSFIETLETDVNDFLGNPLVRAAQIADNLAEKGEDPSDPLRHSTAGALTAQTIANKTGNIPFISNPLGYLGANIVGMGHELSTLYNADLDDRPWSVKLQESLEDMYNNSVGASTIFNNKSEKNKINYLLHLTRTNQLPDGYGEERPFKNNPKWTDPYNKKQYGGALNKFVGGGQPCPKGQIFNPEIGECVPKWKAPNYEVNYDDGSHYNTAAETVYLNPEQIEAEGPNAVTPIMEHEKYHHWQHLQGRDRFPSGTPLRIPSTVDNQDYEGEHYYNRREIEEEQKRKEILNSIGNPDFKFIPKDVVNDRLYYGSGKGGDSTLLEAGSNTLMYLDPTTEEGEARAYENDIRGGMPSMFGEFPKNKHGGLHKFLGGGPTDCGEGMVWDETLKDCVKSTVQDVGTVRMTQYTPYEVKYDEMHPREREIIQKKAEYLAKHKGLNRIAGVTQDNFPEKVLRNIENKVDYERNNYVIDQYAKKHGFNPNKHVDLVENIAEKGRNSYDMAQNSKYGSKLAPSLWSRTLSGVQELGNAAVKLLPGKQGDVFKYKIPGLSKKEAKEKAKSSTGALDAFAILDLPGQAIANTVLEYGKTVTGGTGADYKTKDIPNVVSGESMPGVTDAVSAIFNPLTYTGLASVPNLLGKGIVGAGKGVAAIKNIIAGADDVLPLVTQVDNVAPLLTKVDDVSPLAKVDDARSIQMANKKVPAIIKKADDVVPKKPQGVQQEFAFPTDTPLPKVEVPKPVIDNVPITKVDEIIDDVPVDDVVNIEKNTARAENERKIMEGMDNIASTNKPVAPVEVPTPIPPTIAAPKPLPNKVGNPDFFKQVLDQSPNLSASNRKFYEDVINSVKKQDNLASDAQMELLERIRTGNHSYSGRFGNINSGISPELVTGLTGETNPLFARIANTYTNWVADPTAGMFNKFLSKASPLNAIPQYGNKVAGSVVEIGDILATGVKEGKLVVPKSIGKQGVQGVKKLFGKTNKADELLVKQNKTGSGLYKAGIDPSKAGTNIKVANTAEKQGFIGRKLGKSNKEFKVTNKKDTPLSEIPLEDPGLTIYRRLPFSNKYIVVDKAKLAAGKAQWATTGGSAQKFGEAYGKGLIITGATGAVLWADAPSEEEVKEAKDKVDEIKKENEKILSDTYDENKKIQFKEKTVTTLADGINKGVELNQIINDLMTREKDPVSSEMLIEIFVDNGYSKEEAEDIVNSRIRENSQFKKGGIVLNIDKNKINHWIEQGYHVEEVDDDE